MKSTYLIHISYICFVIDVVFTLLWYVFIKPRLHFSAVSTFSYSVGGVEAEETGIQTRTQRDKNRVYRANRYIIYI